jgi:hypothetical protein
MNADLPLSGFGLSDLARVPLLPQHEAALTRAREVALGEGSWRHCKLGAIRDLFALERISRLTVVGIDPITELRAIVRMPCAVPCLPPDPNELPVASETELGLRYPEEILRGPLPGYSLVEIREPHHVWHANVSSGPSQRLCLAASLPRGYPLREAIVASYAALTLQSVTLDERDPAGVMNLEAARWWQQNAHRIPLTRDPFLTAGGGGAAAGGSS